MARSGLAMLRILQGKADEAVKEFQELLKLMLQELGPNNHQTLACRRDLLVAINSQCRYVEVARGLPDLIQKEEQILGTADLKTLGSRNNLRVALMNLGKAAEAEKEFRELLKIQEQLLGPRA